MSKKPALPDAWEEDWETAADKLPTAPSEPAAEKKVSSKVSKAQRRAQQAEFNRKLWEEAEGPKETFHFLETRPNATVPLRTEFKPAPILLSRKGPSSNSTQHIGDSVANLKIRGENESSDEEDGNKQVLTLAERQAKAAREREVKQRKYEERRQELFGSSTTSTTTTPTPTSTSSPAPPVATTSTNTTVNGHSGSSTSRNTTPTPPGSRSATPNRNRGRGNRRGAGGVNTTTTTSNKEGPQRREKELFDPSYTPKPDSVYLQRQRDKAAAGGVDAKAPPAEGQPIRAPRGPDGSGRGGFGFSARGAKTSSTTAQASLAAAAASSTMKTA